MPDQIYNANTRKFLRASYGEGDVKTLDMNSRGDLLAAMALPERTEIVRQGASFHAQIPLASAWTLLITVPTTLANLSLQNGEAVGGKSYVIERFWIKNTTSTASAGVITPLSQLVAPGTALVANDATVLRTSLNGNKKTASSLAQLVMASTVTGCLQDKWNHHPSVVQSPTTNIATVVEVLCYGRYIVPPQGSFNINAQESVSGGAAICGVEWHEIQLDCN